MTQCTFYWKNSLPLWPTISTSTSFGSCIRAFSSIHTGLRATNLGNAIHYFLEMLVAEHLLVGLIQETLLIV